MEYRLERDSIEDYLKESSYVDWGAENIQAEAKRLFAGCAEEGARIKAAFEFVRDEIAHSWDIESERITKTASEALRYKEGICYAKSMLLAALLRSAGIPTGFCYQILTLGDTPETGYCVHALNAVYLSALNCWVRVDARGNTNGKNAQFDPAAPQKEQLAFLIRPEYGEVDDPTIYAQPLPITTETLENNTNCLDMLRFHLPKSI